VTDIFLGWDMGAWHCDRGKSQDALCALVADDGGNPRLAGKPRRVNLRDTLIASGGLPLLRSLLALVGVDFSAHGSVTIAIDAALGWPEAFVSLLLQRQLPEEIPKKQADNKILFRRTDWFLNQKKHRPLSVVQDQISSQSTKGIYFLKTSGLTRRGTGVWATVYEDSDLSATAIETYPAPCKKCGVFDDLVDAISKQREFQEALLKNGGDSQDIQDALRCALVAFRFAKDTSSLLPPEEAGIEIPADEGWIWLPRECYGECA
jgi:Protein of unknown function (DUF429)